MGRPLPLLEALLADAHLSAPDDLPALASTHGGRLGAVDVGVFLVDLDQRVLVRLPEPGQTAEALSVEGTLAGRCFRTVAIVDAPGPDGELTMWVPMLDGTERLGVVQLRFPAGHVDVEETKAFAGVLAELVVSKSQYGDFFEHARRTEPLTIGSELLWQLLPPLTFGGTDIVIAATFMPTARLGGDAFDYGVSSTTARVAIFDAVGHDLRAGLLATTAVAAFRNARRSGLDLEPAARHIGSAIADHFGDSQFVTGILTSLDLDSGRLSWTTAGHPAPLVIRRGRVVKHLDDAIGMPFGIGPASAVGTEQLEAGDRVLLYTDGVTEARDPDGDLFGTETLVDLVSRGSHGVPPPETMRQLMHAVLAHNDGPLRDDATAVMIEWRGEGRQHLEVD